MEGVAGEKPQQVSVAVGGEDGQQQQTPFGCDGPQFPSGCVCIGVCADEGADESEDCRPADSPQVRDSESLEQGLETGSGPAELGGSGADAQVDRQQQLQGEHQGEGGAVVAPCSKSELETADATAAVAGIAPLEGVSGFLAAAGLPGAEAEEEDYDE